MARTQVQRFEAFCRVIRVCSAVCGADITDPNYRLSALTWLVIALINLFIGLTFYTMYVTLIVNKDWVSMMQSVSMMGSGIQGYCKLVNAIWNRKQLKFLLDELHGIYEEYEKKHEAYRCHLTKSLYFATNIIKSVAVTYIFATSSFILLTVVLRVIYKERVFVLHFLFPGIDPDTDVGYLILNSIHVVFLLFGSFGNFAGDMYFFTYVCHAPLIKNILSCKFHDLNKILLLENSVNTAESMHMLKDIFSWHQKYIIIIANVKETYFWVIVVQVGTTSMGIACTIFCTILGNWKGGYIYLFYCFVLLYIYCGLGTLIEISNDGFVDSCYNDVTWYKLSVREQKLLQIMLMMAQRTVGLTVGAVVPLSMNTGLQVTKAVYTWGMMLINMID